MLRDPTDSYAQRLLITVLGDYEHLSQQSIPSAALVSMMEEFDISTDSTRTALSRLVKRGHLERFKTGRTTGYRLSAFGKQLTREARERIQSFGLPHHWDGMWTIVAFSVAENRRQNRHVLRSQLRALGFAPFYDGLWIASDADSQSVSEQLRQVEDADIAVFRGSLVDQPRVSFAKLFDTWKLDDVRQGYDEFIETFTALRERVLQDAVPPAESFVTRTRLMDAWRVFPRIDPDLPDSILPDDWPRERARSLFSDIYDALAPTSELRFRSFLGARAS